MTTDPKVTDTVEEVAPEVADTQPQAPAPPEAAAEEVLDGELAADSEEEVVEAPAEEDIATKAAMAGEYLALAQRHPG